ncbi:molybdenum ABC transporter ATP-binding protein [Roseomonas haemaphysalidis]|uniref:Molybdenum ABC transporter ATP-binding protein n=1 Tax=Roseomonas haemaphysalidis TaxID=2768162 RepID=A0ABS3KMF6_9PROT|nr:molybdenum ABC transporter ATP-binding protein [Roseomonas haemaphysalidis]MBO1078659.1 molybdenum ABC transporter ATP-binding protein [Roseomonas haemaphysalidis]
MLEVALRHDWPGFSLDVGFRAPAAGVTALFGPSGCGKSTILAAVAGLLRPDAGRIALGDAVLFDHGGRRMVPAERRRCGMVFQDARLFPHLSVSGNLRYGLRRAPRGTTGPGFDEVVSLLGIEALLARRPAALSGGEKQRVALGRALLSRPAMLLMDEPLAALDAPRKAEVLPFLARLRQELSIPLLYVTHALEEVDQLADSLVLLAGGRVLASGAVEALAARTDLPMLAGRRDAGALLPCTVLAHDPARQLTRLGFPGGTLSVPLAPAPVGSTQRLRLRARDVAVATEEPRGLSVQNVLPVVLEALEPGAAGEAMLRLRAGPSLLLARVTLDSAHRLSLRPGQPLWALVKSVALAPRGPGA